MAAALQLFRMGMFPSPIRRCWELNLLWPFPSFFLSQRPTPIPFFFPWQVALSAGFLSPQRDIILFLPLSLVHHKVALCQSIITQLRQHMRHIDRRYGKVTHTPAPLPSLRHLMKGGRVKQQTSVAPKRSNSKGILNKPAPVPCSFSSAKQKAPVLSRF